MREQYECDLTHVPEPDVSALRDSYISLTGSLRQGSVKSSSFIQKYQPGLQGYILTKNPYISKKSNLEMIKH